MAGPPIAFRAFGGGSLDAYVANRRRFIRDNPRVQTLQSERNAAVENARSEGFSDGVQETVELQKQAFGMTPIGRLTTTAAKLAGSDDPLGDVGEGVTDAAKVIGAGLQDGISAVSNTVDLSGAAAAAIGVGAFFITRTLQRDDDARAFIRATTAALVAGGLAYTQKQRLKQLPIVGWLF